MKIGSRGKMGGVGEGREEEFPLPFMGRGGGLTTYGKFSKVDVSCSGSSKSYPLSL